MSMHKVLYDDGCSFCTFQMKLLRWLDWTNKFALVPVSDPETARIAPQLSARELNEAIHCVTPQGAVHRGARAIRFISLRLPVTVPLALILWIPGVILAAEKVYAWISRNRQTISRVFGCKGACALVPDRPGPDPR